ncbi:MAG: M23 family metallopeptidase, partial [Microbacteriaceae bacterium]|nr:M23 family metallopeptidase [Microbacteriaceae bacterium]
MKLTFFLLLAFFSSVNPASVASEPLVMPISGASHLDVINQYEAPLSEYGTGHRGVDLAAPIGTEVIAPVSGEISFSGQVGYRESITILFGNSFRTSLEPVCSEFIEGTPVLAGDVIGT